MTATLVAPAKLTWSLRVTGVRDDGHHLIDAEMVALSLGDVLSVDELDGGDGALTVGGPFAAGVPLDATNLVTKALRAAGRSARVHVDKHIPHGGGLGGGSSDAAAVLRWAGIADLGIGARLGADVPFCMVGGRARVRGVGEIVDALQPLERVVTLVIPPLSCSTPAVYAAWDALGGPAVDGPNDLEPAALAVEPRLERWRDRIAEAAGTRPALAGSGATWFVEGDRPEIAVALDGATVIVARTTG